MKLDGVVLGSPYTPQIDTKARMEMLQSLAPVRTAQSAKEACEDLHDAVIAFEDSLNADEEVGIALVSFGLTRQIVVTSFVALGPAMLAIKGYENESEVILIQHLSQLSFLLVPIKRKDPEQPRRKIGFGESV